ncbi:MAG: phosphate acyltransferase PlsX [Lentisphaeria bacterium]|nr:phosphate acyltransferase PlsX [Lentisphaeria bacterium]
MATIAVDAMGGDFAPRAVVEGAAESLDLLEGDFDILLVGAEEQVRDELERVGKAGSARIRVVDASESIGMGESPASAVRSKKKASINVAVDLVKGGEANAVVSAGNTGAAVAASVLKLRVLPGVERPGIATVFPSPNGHFVLLDVGSNIDCKPSHLVQYAIMGDIYEREVLGTENPRIGLLNIGDETGKGNELTREAFALLDKVRGINFIGNVEGHDLFGGGVDVVVCDGFVGNVVLKASESLAHAIQEILKRNLFKNPLRVLGAFLSRNAYRELKQACDSAEFGGVPLLGINGVCIIGHGASGPKAIRNGIRVALECIDHCVNEHIVEALSKHGTDTN